MRLDKLNPYFTKLTFLKGVGPKLYEYFKLLVAPKKEVAYFKDLLFHLPYNVINRRKDPENLGEYLGKEVVLSLKVISINKVKFGRNYGTKIKTLYGVHIVELTFFSFNEYMKTNFTKDKDVFVAGKLEQYKSNFNIIHPQVLTSQTQIESAENYPIYGLTAGVKNNNIIKIISQNIDKLEELPEWCDEQFAKKNNFKPFLGTLKSLHQAKSNNDLDLDGSLIQRLAYDELLANQLAIAISREKVVKLKGKQVPFKTSYSNIFLDNVGFQLTGDQEKCLMDVKADIEGENRMFRLVQGDVGSGKTIVGAIAVLSMVEAGFQAAFMAPTEILARQHFDWITSIINQTDLQNKVRVGYLSGSLKEAEKRKVREQVANGEIDIIIGTHSLFQEAISYKNLGLIIIDEQHRFGVKQRMDLAEKGDGVNILFMTATPIPRTLTMTVFGDMDVSIIAEKPAGRKPILTSTLSEKKTADLVEKLKSEVAKGKRIYWVCPLVEEQETNLLSDEGKVISVNERYSYLKEHFGDQVGIVHGQLKADVKEKEIQKFKNGVTKILVATTVIEVGVNVPEATIMVIENSERFGLSQLHQLRGRVGRGSEQSTCILLYSSKLSEFGRKRLKTMKDTEDGFKIAEEDMVLRGTGELLGTRQSGLPDYKIAMLPEHKDLLFAATDQTKIIINQDPKLISEKGLALRQLLYLFEFDDNIKKLNA